MEVYPKMLLLLVLAVTNLFFYYLRWEQQNLQRKPRLISQRAMEAPWSIKHTTLNVTASMGISLVLSTEETVSTILKNADYAMYEVKKSGGNSFEILSFG